jgi:DNA-binding MarR family transcriptional regulator
MERHLKGVANHWRIDILLLIDRRKVMILEEIAEELKMNIKTASEHTHRLARAGLINKRYQGRQVEHTLSPYGHQFVKFLRHLQKTFQYS